MRQIELELQNEKLRRVQCELEAARDRLSALYDFAPVGYLTLDQGGVIREANLAAANLLGAKSESLAGGNFIQFVASGDRKTFRLHCRRVETAAGRVACELRMRRKGGGEFMAELESKVTVNNEKSRREHLIILTEITERLKWQSEIRRLAAIVDSSNDAIVSRDLHDRITSWNPGAAGMFGYSAGEVMGRNIALLAPRDARAEVRNQKTRIVGGQRIEHFNTVRVGKNGKEVPVSLSVSPVRGPEGRVIGLSTIMRDMTGQKQAVEALRHSEHNLSEFFEKSPLGLMWVGPRGQILRINQAQLELLDRPAKEVLGRRVGEFHVDSEIAENFIERLGAGETLQNHRARLRQPSGSIKHVLIDANGLWKNGALVHSRWFVRDITRRIELEREILSIAEHEQQRIGQDLHDDLGQQLAGIEFLAQTLARHLATQSRTGVAQAREIAAITRRTMVRTRELARGLSPIGLESNGLMNGLRELAARTGRLFDADCRFRCRSQVPVHDHTVAIHLYRIAQEAVSNAIRHGKARRIDIGLALNRDRIVPGGE